ncbi:nonsense-mediated mRNA decay protein 3 [Mytilus galloprovincialis]|uniref:Nonsense-mediated mRNA decay protein 3 n=4 Tax=Mytilus TaxID=6548 RepID=A0A8B6D4P1_MYTGA|nr:nonsense-mediated mRNA decay protein 3 [Mytilus galloprovincialis]
MLVKKIFGNKNSRNKKRKWKLKHLHDDLHADTSSNERDYTDFLEDLEEDEAFRKNVDIYKDADKLAVDADDTDDEECPQISLQEMLDDLHISTDATGDDGADMMMD